MNVSPRVNFKRLPDYVGKTVRLTGKTIKFVQGKAIVETSDGGQVEVHLTPDANMADTYVEIIGSVVDPTTIKMMAVVNLGSDLDLKLVNDVVELIHDPRFYDKLYAP